MAYSDQGSGREGQDKLKTRLVGADEPAIAQATDSHIPTKASFDPIADDLAGHLTRMVGSVSKKAGE